MEASKILRINKPIKQEPKREPKYKSEEERLHGTVSKIEKMAYTESKKSDKQALDGRRIFKQLNGNYQGLESRNEVEKPKRTVEQIKEKERERTTKMFNGCSPEMFPELFNRVSK